MRFLIINCLKYTQQCWVTVYTNQLYGSPLNIMCTLKDGESPNTKGHTHTQTHTKIYNPASSWILETVM